MILATGSMVIVRLKYQEKIGSFYVPDNAQAFSGEFWGEVVAVGPEFNDKSLKVGDRLSYLRAEGYRFVTFCRDETLFAIKERWCYARA
jgi:threonine dehydrogenase-like Zn-dependent dehydrogenase